MFCRECGTRNTENSTFCESCGAKLVMPKSNSQSNMQQQHERQRNRQPQKTKPNQKRLPLVIGLVAVLIIGAIALSFLFRSGAEDITQQPDEPKTAETIEEPTIEQEEPIKIENIEPNAPEINPPEETEEDIADQEEAIILDGVVLTHPLDIEVPYRLSRTLTTIHEWESFIAVFDPAPTLVIGYMYGLPGIDMHMQMAIEATHYSRGFEISYIRFYDNSIFGNMIEDISNIACHSSSRYDGIFNNQYIITHVIASETTSLPEYQNTFRGRAYFFLRDFNVLFIADMTLAGVEYTDNPYIELISMYDIVRWWFAHILDCLKMFIVRM